MPQPTSVPVKVDVVLTGARTATDGVPEV